MPDSSTFALSAPQTVTAPTSALTPVGGIVLTGPFFGDTSASGDYSYTVTVGVRQGILLVPPTGPVEDLEARPSTGTVSGEGTSTLVLTGSIDQVSRRLAAIDYVGTTGQPDQIDVTATSQLGTGGTPSTLTASVAVVPAAAPPTSGHTLSTSGAVAWNTGADWTSPADPGHAPIFTDPVTLPGGVPATLSGPGVAGTLDVAGADTLTGAVDVQGAATVTGMLAVAGGTAGDPARLITGSGTIGGSGAAAVRLTQGAWANAGALSLSSGSSLTLGPSSTLSTGGLNLAAGSVTETAESATLAAAGAVTSGGVLISLGGLSASSLTLGAGSDTIAQSTMRLSSLTVEAGALIGGSVAVRGAAGQGSAAAIANDGTIEGAVAADPLVLEGSVSGTGTLLVDGGGGLELDGPVGSGQTVTFAPGLSPVYVDADGAAGGALVLDDPQDFAGTIRGFEPGDRLFVVPQGGQSVTGATLRGSSLVLTDGAGDTVDSLAFDGSDLPAGTTFAVLPNDPDASLADPTSNPDAVEIEAVPASGLALSTTGRLRIGSGGTAPVPMVSAYDPTAASGSTYTITLTAGSGRMTELLSLPAFFNGLTLKGFDNPLATLPSGDGTLKNDAGQTLVAVSGTGTSSLTISGTNLELVDLQAALAEYEAGAAGTDAVSVAFSDGAKSAGATVPVAISDPGTTFQWITGRGDDAGDASNWMASDGEAGSPGAQDDVLFGAGNDAVTGELLAKTLAIEGNVLTQGPIFVGGTSGGPSLVVDRGGIAGFAGFLYVGGDASVGRQGAGELDLEGVLNDVTGDLAIGDGAAGLVQVGGFLSVGGTVEVGQAGDGRLVVDTDLSGTSNITGTGSLYDGGAVVGATAGFTGSVLVTGGTWATQGTLVVGGAGTGSVDLSDTSGDGAIYSQALVLGQQAGGVGTLLVDSPDDVRVGTTTVGAGGDGTLVVAGSFDTYDYGTDGEDPLDIGTVAGGSGTVDVTGSLTAGDLDVGAAGTLNLASGSVAAGTIEIEAGGQATVGADLRVDGAGTLAGAVALAGGTLGVESLAVASTGTLAGFGRLGEQYLGDTVSNGGTITATGSGLEVVADLTSPSGGGGALQIASGSRLTLDGKSDGGQSLSFLGAGTLVLAQPFQYGGESAESGNPPPVNDISPTIVASGTGDVIDFSALAGGGNLRIESYSDSVLQVELMTTADDFPFALVDITVAGHEASDFTVQDDGNGGQEIAIAGPQAFPPAPPAAPAVSAPSADADIRNTAPPIQGTGAKGDTVTVTITPANGADPTGGTALVSDGIWHFTPSAPLADGTYTVSATQTDLYGQTSAPTLDTFTIDTTPPVTTPAGVTVAPNSGATPLGIAPPTDTVTPAASIALAVSSLPSDGTVRDAAGAAVSVGETLTAAGLASLTFTPTPGLSGQSSLFSYTATDAAGNRAIGSASLAITGQPSPAISGTHATDDAAEAPVAPFAGVMVADPVQGASDSLRIVLAGGGGALTDPGGALTRNADGSYALAATDPATLSAELDRLRFTPANDTPGATVSTTFDLAVASSAGTTAADGATSVTDTASAAAPPSNPAQGPAPASPPASTPPSTSGKVSIAPQVTYQGGVFTLTGTASSAGGVKSVEISAVSNYGPRQDLGAATVNADGTFTFEDRIGADLQGFIEATVTDAAGGTATSPDPLLSLRGGLGRTYGAASEARYTADGEHVTAVTRFGPLGSEHVLVSGAGQTFDSAYDDTFQNHREAGTAFVFEPGFSLDVVDGFRLRGAGHDTMSFLGSDFGTTPQARLGSLLAHSQESGGNLSITDPTSGDVVQLGGVTKAGLAHDERDIVFR